MDKAIILGLGQFAEGLFFFLQQEKKVEICGFSVDKQYINCDTFYGLPVVDFAKIETVFSPKDYGVYVCIGFAFMNEARERMFRDAQRKGYRILSYCHPTAVVNAKSMGIGNICLENVTIGPFCEIGDGNVFRANAHLAHNAKVGNFNYFTISVAIAGRMNIGNNCFFGNNCTIKDGLNIADKTLVGAGCYISKDTEKGGVYVPAQTVHLNKNSTDFFRN